MKTGTLSEQMKPVKRETFLEKAIYNVQFKLEKSLVNIFLWAAVFKRFTLKLNFIYTKPLFGI
jgi:hypothetical protein